MTLSIIPNSGYYQAAKPTGFNLDTDLAIPESFSYSSEDIKYAQQTFLGASIRSFNINAGYGDNTSTLSVELVNDEYNTSDYSPKGSPYGDDIYHSGIYDRFAPPPVGSPVFFKFGRTKASIDDAYGYMYDSTYGTESAVGPSGKFHLCFGGILQSYVQNRGPGGNPLYSAQVVDPREILSNVQLILNNYAGTIFSHQNMYNIYGFLEFNASASTRILFGDEKNVLEKIVNSNGVYELTGKDLYTKIPAAPSMTFPITGTGYSRRCPQGMPFYRIKQAMIALMGMEIPLPQEYIDAGFGGYINFRGHNYVVDLSGLKNIPDYYFFDFDQINLLDLCLEICDITSSELFVSLLPIINHPKCAVLKKWNDDNGKDPRKLISGIIKVDSISRSFQPQFGAIKNYIDTLRNIGIPVENQDVGFELSNIVTDKFIVGAQEVDMHYFSANADRDTISVRQTLGGTEPLNIESQWRLKTSLKQQILPYYGLLGNKAVTIPKGYGSYQQILLDSSHLNANGVGKYYVATELELRAAAISYEQWCNFLLSYNDIYMEPLEGDAAGGVSPDQIPLGPDVVGIDLEKDGEKELSGGYAVTVPRCVFDSDDPTYGSDNLPSSPCSPPFGYPLYYKRATKIGVMSSGLTGLTTKLNGIITSLAEFGGAANRDELTKVLKNTWEELSAQSPGDMTALEIELKRKIETLLANTDTLKKADVIGLIQEFESSAVANGLKAINRLSKQTKENSLKVYNFLKSIADECLGKKFLIKIPTKVNLYYTDYEKSRGDLLSQLLGSSNDKYDYGPFGFKPRSVSSGVRYEFTSSFINEINLGKQKLGTLSHHFDSFLSTDVSVSGKFTGALVTNLNPLTDSYEYNYIPEKQGGYFNFEFLQTVNGKVRAVNEGFIPQDFQKFILDNYRISSYVRYDNSQFLSFDGIDSNSFTQQKEKANYFIPDLVYSLDNVSEDRDKFMSFDPTDQPAPEKTIAFVKCDLDDKFYMPPKTFPASGQNGLYRVNTHGNKVIDIKKIHPPYKRFVCDTDTDSPTYGSGIWKRTKRFFTKLPVPTRESADGQEAKDVFFIRDSGGYIKTKNEDLDTNNVYALITIPGRIVATKDSRYRDSIMQNVNPAMLKHSMTMDVVKISEFTNPTVAPPTNPLALIPLDNAKKITAQLIYNRTLERAINYSLNNLIAFASPSPIYPDLVALPLMSKERCYGPWISSLLDVQANVYSNIGGKIDFIKDENLSPWNYQGYDLMNAAGIMQAQFANSLLLQSERGGFVIPAAPSGIAIGRSLSNFGPLITNLSIDISDESIRTTVKMDLYTSSFGKLQKQKQDAIANISRERQKLKDERNSTIRRGMAKNQTNVNYSLMYQQIKDMNTRSSNTQLALNSPKMTELVLSVNSDNTLMMNPGEYRLAHSASLQSMENIGETASHMPDSIGTANKYYNSAGASLAQVFSPYSNEPHNNMPYVPYNNRNYTQRLYDQEDIA